MRYLNVFLLALILSGEIAAYCPRIFVKLSSKGADATAFWKRTGESSAESGGTPFRFGWDAELWSNTDSLAIIGQHKPSWKALHESLEENGPYYTLAQLGRMFDMSAAETRRALNAGTDKADGDYVLTDLKRSTLATWEHGNKEKNEYAPLLWEHVDSAMKAKGIPVSAKLETDSGNKRDQAVELVMDGALSSPAEFRKLIDWLYKTVENPETHFHVSVPSAYIEADQMVFATRALETKILLDQIADPTRDYHDTYAPHDATSFVLNLKTVRRNSEPQVERGIVRVESYRWDSKTTHDVEIRDWIDKKHALENMHFMMELVKNAGRLRDSSTFKTKAMRNTMPPTLNGALRYAAFMLEDRLPASKQYIANDLVALAAELERSRKISPEAREKVGDYLRDNNVLKYLTLETFLEPE